MLNKFPYWGLFLVVILAFQGNDFPESGVSSVYSPEATGKLLLSVRNDSSKFICQEINVLNGVFQGCDSNSIPTYKYFIKRDEVDKNWLSDLARQYDEFPDVNGADSKQKWFFFEEKKSHHNKEDFTSIHQKTGVTYRHHESKKSIIAYSMANPRGKAYVDESKFHCQYDWEENIKGKYESFFNNGGKKFRHKYLVNRFMTLGKDHENSKRKSSMEINLNGTIEKYYENGKKQSLVTYTDYYSVGKKIEDKERIVLKSDRKGLKKKFYESGKLFCSGEFGMKGFEGGVEYYSLKGAIIKVENYKAGVLHGKVNEFFLDGTQKLKGNYKNGKKIGKWQTYDSSGKPISSIKY